MESNKAIHLLEGILTEIIGPGGYAATNSFSSLREVDAKIRETKMVLTGTEGLPPNFVSEMGADENFQARKRGRCVQKFKLLPLNLI